MKLLIAVGGGGHFSPALGVLDKIPKEWNVLLVGRKHTFEGDSALSFEYQTAQKLNIPFVPLTTGRLQRRFTAHTLSSLVKIPVGLAQAVSLLKKYQPDVVLSFGGYVSVPVALAAKMLKIPIVIHEQTLHAGLANKIVSKFADKVCVSWKESEEFFPRSKVVLTGNPLRKEFLDSRLRGNDKTEGVPLIYITGGSGGAHGINVLVEGCLEKLLENFFVIHQTGDAREFGDFAQLEKLKTALPAALHKRYLLKKFIEPKEVFYVLSNADLVVARSGINTVTELLFLGKPSLLIPLPHGQRNEQRSNALFFQKTGLGEVFDQDALTPGLFFEKIQEMVANLRLYKSHAHETQKLIPTDAAERIIEIIGGFRK